jgi:hypothetical protein
MDHGSGSPADCTSIAPLLGHYLAERLGEADRQKVRAHLLSCPGCSTEALQLDPSILFIQLGRERPSPATWAGFDAALRSRLEAEPAPRRGFFAGWDFGRLETARRPRLAFAAPLAMVALLAGLVFVSQPGMILRGPRPQVEGIRPPQEIGAPIRPALDPRGPAERLDRGPRASLRLAADEAALLPTLEEVSSPAARVYRLDVAGAPTAADAGAVYFVVDETINF